MNEVGAERSVKIPPGSLIIANSGVSLGFAAITGVEGCIHDGWLLISDFNGIDRNCWFYWVNYATSKLRGLADGTTQPNLNTGLARSLRIPLPPLTEQRAIADLLWRLDDKIELNRRMNATLEAMARALFQSWFVDFDPVRAKAAGQAPAGMDPATAALFPSEFEDSAFGDIPKGWEVRKISEVTERVTKGDTPRSEALEAASQDARQVPMFRVNAITDGGEVLLDKRELIPESIHFGKSKRSILHVNDILYTNAGTIGRVALVQEDWLPSNTNQAIAIIRPSIERVPCDFLYCLMRQKDFQANLHHDVVHAVQANLALGKISDARGVFPPASTIGLLFAPISQLLSHVFQNHRQSRILAALRDALLPKLMSGELSVNAAETMAAPEGAMS